jgi:pyruvate kinase
LQVDGLMLEIMIQEDDPLDIITNVSELLAKYELEIDEDKTARFYEDSDFIVRDYIIYNANRITTEVDVKAIVCYTENGYTTAKLSSLAPRVPVIAFTKSDETYRYLNTLWGVR